MKCAAAGTSTFSVTSLTPTHWLQTALGAKKTHFRQNKFEFTAGRPVLLPKRYDHRKRSLSFVDNQYFSSDLPPIAFGHF